MPLFSRRGQWLLALASLVVTFVAGERAAAAQDGNQVLLVINAQSAASEAVGQYYAEKRSIPATNVLRLSLPESEEIGRPQYEAAIQQPIADWLTANAAQDRILYIVLTKGVPLRISGTVGPNGTVSSVDSELTLLYRRMTGALLPIAGRINNPYFRGDQSTTHRFSHKQFDIYLVGRLDGYTVDDVQRMISLGSMPVREGKIVLDGRLEVGLQVGNRWLADAAGALKRQDGWSERIVLDTGLTKLSGEEQVIGYYSWGSNASGVTERRFGHQFVPGALAAEFVSTDARTFKEPPADWIVNDEGRLFEGSQQSLIGDFVRDGITGTAGHVAEPYLNGTIRPDVLFPAYVSGHNLIESFYMAMPALSWQTVVIGDPLCAPFEVRQALSAEELNPPLDEASGMPQLFADRRRSVFMAAGAKPEAIASVMRAEVFNARGDKAARRQALVDATTIDPDFTPANMVLAPLLEEAGEWDAAIERYRRIIARVPTSAFALNNVAYLLSVRKNSPAEALPFAVRAYSLSVQEPTVGDTLAWIHHQMGNDRLAFPIIAVAAQRLPNVAEVQFHAAAIFAGIGDTPSAQRALDAAIKLDAALADRDDVKELQRRLQAQKPQ